MSAITVKLNADFEKSEELLKKELAKVGFGILTKIDVADTLKKKIDVDFEPLVILGACNPKFAHKALSYDIDLSLLLPCNITLSKGNDTSYTVVKAVDPRELLGDTTKDDTLKQLADDAYNALEEALHNAQQCC
jgi:uncharacterized protein (DUF302 family)